MLVPGKGNLVLTGKLGDVTQESVRSALTYARSAFTRPELQRYLPNMPDDFYQKNDVHIRVAAGAIPKDGPSAGITMEVAFVSALSKRAVSRDIRMTGEITLRGKVPPVGGIRDKVLAAHGAGLRRVARLKENEKNLEEIP
jgi:ATP-dependent Lon protease